MGRALCTIHHSLGRERLAPRAPETQPRLHLCPSLVMPRTRGGCQLPAERAASPAHHPSHRRLPTGPGQHPRAARCLRAPRSPTWPCHPSCAQLLGRRATGQDLTQLPSPPATRGQDTFVWTAGACDRLKHTQNLRKKNSCPGVKVPPLLLSSLPRSPRSGEGTVDGVEPAPRRARPASHTSRARLPEHLTSRCERLSPRVKPGHPGERRPCCLALEQPRA